jgi:hypothetical protein
MLESTRQEYSIFVLRAKDNVSHRRQSSPSDAGKLQAGFVLRAEDNIIQRRQSISSDARQHQAGAIFLLKATDNLL